MTETNTPNKEESTHKVIIRTVNNLTITVYGTEETVDKLMNYFENTDDKVYRIINDAIKDDIIINPQHVVCIQKELNNNSFDNLVDRIKEKRNLIDRVKEEVSDLIKRKK